MYSVVYLIERRYNLMQKKEHHSGKNRQKSQDPQYKGTERRSGRERRRGKDRRKSKDPHYKGPERRSGRDRRSGQERRKSK